MNGTDYKPNSHKYKQEQSAPEEKRQVGKVVTGKVKTKKKNEIRKLADVFISEDVKNVKSYILMDVLIPAVKKAVSDVVTNGIDMLLYGGTGRSGKSYGGSKISYRNYYDQKDDGRRYSDTSKTRARFDYDDIVFESRPEAEAVREEMNNVIERYGFVTVADMYDMAELSQPYTSNRYGWTNIRTAEVVRVREGYILKLPKALPIE